MCLPAIYHRARRKAVKLQTYRHPDLKQARRSKSNPWASTIFGLVCLYHERDKCPSKQQEGCQDACLSVWPRYQSACLSFDRHCNNTRCHVTPESGLGSQEKSHGNITWFDIAQTLISESYDTPLQLFVPGNKCPGKLNQTRAGRSQCACNLGMLILFHLQCTRISTRDFPLKSTSNQNIES